MAIVKVVPSGITFEPSPDESILEAAWRSGLYWPTTCEGNGTCTVCVFTVLDGAGALSVRDQREADGLALVRRTMPGDPDSHRLACQARATGDVTVRKVGVRVDDRSPRVETSRQE